MPQWHSGQRWRHAGTERWRLRAGGRGYDRISEGSRFAKSRFAQSRLERRSQLSFCPSRPADSVIARASSTRTERGRYIILRVNYRLQRGGAPSLKYADLQKHFADRVTNSAGKKTPPSLAEVREVVRAIRRSKGHADRPRRRRLPQRRIVLQEPRAQRGAVQRTCRACGSERARNSQLPGARSATQSFGGVAGRTFRLLQRIWDGRGRNLDTNMRWR